MGKSPVISTCTEFSRTAGRQMSNPSTLEPHVPRRRSPLLAYSTIGTSDMDRAVAFYNTLLAEIGAKQLFGMDRIKFYGTSTDESMLALCIP